MTTFIPSETSAYFFTPCASSQQMPKKALISKIVVLNLILIRKIFDDIRIRPAPSTAVIGLKRPLVSIERPQPPIQILMSHLRHIQGALPLYTSPCMQLLQEYSQIESSSPGEIPTTKLQEAVTKTEQLIRVIIENRPLTEITTVLSPIQQTCMLLQHLFKARTFDELDPIHNLLFQRPAPNILKKLCTLGGKLHPYGHIVLDLLINAHSTTIPSTKLKLSQDQIETAASNLMLLIRHGDTPTNVPLNLSDVYRWLANEAEKIRTEIHEANKSSKQLQICDLLERYFCRQDLAKRLEECDPLDRYAEYMDILESFHFFPDRDEDHLAYVQERIHTYIVEELFDTGIPLSAEIDATIRFDQNLQALQESNSLLQEVTARFTEIEREVFPLPDKIARIIRGVHSVRKWENLVEILNQYSKPPIPTTLSPKTRSEVVSNIIFCIREVQKIELLQKQRAFCSQAPEIQKNEQSAKQAVSSLFSCRTGGELGSFLNLIKDRYCLTDTLQYELKILYAFQKDTIEPFENILSHIFACLATGSYITPDEAEKILSSIIFLIDYNVSPDKMPQNDFVQGSEWIGTQTKILIDTARKDQREFIRSLRERELFSSRRLAQVHVPKIFADLLVTRNGQINYALSPLLCNRLLPQKEERDAIQNQIGKILNQLRTSSQLVSKLEEIRMPRPGSTGETLVRLCLNIAKGSKITPATAKKAVLVTLLTWARQDDLGDCSVFGPYGFALDQATCQLVDDFSELLSVGTITRGHKRLHHSVPGLLWPALYASKYTIPYLSENDLLHLYDFPPFRASLDELGNIPKNLWEKIVREAEKPYDIRKIFICINKDVNTVQKALFFLEAHQESPLKRVWQNATGSLSFIPTPHIEMNFPNIYFSSILRACDEMALTINRQAKPSFDERPLLSSFNKLRLYCIPQGANILQDVDLSWLFFIEKDEGHVLLRQEDLDIFLRGMFTDRYPHLPISTIPKMELLRKFLKKLTDHGPLWSHGEINGIIFTSHGGEALQDIFDKQVYPRLLSANVPTDPEQFIRFAKIELGKAKIERESFVLAASTSHVFRVLLNHKSVSSCFDNPRAALNGQSKFAEFFFRENRSYREWFEIALKNNLTQWIVTLTSAEGEKIGTLKEFVHEIVRKDPQSQGQDLRNEELLLLKYLVQECKTQQRTAVIHFGDTSYGGPGEPISMHYGFLYNPLKGNGRWVQVQIDEKDNPATLVIISTDMLLKVPQDSLVQRSLLETKKQQDLQQLRKTRKHFDLFKRDFTHAFPLLKESLARSQTVDLAETTKRPIPTNVAEATDYIRKRFLQFQKLMLSLKILDPKHYLKILDSVKAPLLKDPERIDVALDILLKQGF